MRHRGPARRGARRVGGRRAAGRRVHDRARAGERRPDRGHRRLRAGPARDRRRGRARGRAPVERDPAGRGGRHPALGGGLRGARRDRRALRARARARRRARLRRRPAGVVGGGARGVGDRRGGRRGPVGGRLGTPAALARRRDPLLPARPHAESGALDAPGGVRRAGTADRRAFLRATRPAVPSSTAPRAGSRAALPAAGHAARSVVGDPRGDRPAEPRDPDPQRGAARARPDAAAPVGRAGVERAAAARARRAARRGAPARARAARPRGLRTRPARLGRMPRLVLSLAGLVLLVAVVVGVWLRDNTPAAGVAVVPPPPGAHGVEPFADPYAWEPSRAADLEQRAAAGNSHVLYALSPGGVVTSAERTARWRPLIERAAAAARLDPDMLEALVFLESAGREDARAPGGLDAAAGLTQILAETGNALLGMHVDVAASSRHTRRLER